MAYTPLKGIKTLMEEIRDFVQSLHEVAQNLRVLGKIQDTSSGIRATITNTPNVGITGTPSIANISTVGGYQLNPIVQAQTNLTAQQNINNIIIS